MEQKIYMQFQSIYHSI